MDVLREGSLCVLLNVAIQDICMRSIQLVCDSFAGLVGYCYFALSRVVGVVDNLVMLVLCEKNFLHNLHRGGRLVRAWFQRVVQGV